MSIFDRFFSKKSISDKQFHRPSKNRSNKPSNKRRKRTLFENWDSYEYQEEDYSEEAYRRRALGLKAHEGDFEKGSFEEYEAYDGEEVEEDYEEIDGEDALTYNREDVDFHNEKQRTRYVTICLEQMTEASLELELLRDEYNLVTSYLTDIEEIEALPDGMREELNEVASHLAGLEDEAMRFATRKSRMKDVDYYTIKKQEDQIEEAIGKLQNEERYAKLIKKDLRRLHGERHAHEFRIAELDKIMGNAKGMAMIFLIAFAVCIGLLFFLQFGLEMDAFVGFFIAIAAFAVAETVLVIQYTDSDRERIKVKKELNKIIQLQNTVKIRYVNNRKLLNYLYMKYHARGAANLEKLWRDYQQEKEDRRAYTEAAAQTEYYQKALLEKLSGIHVQTPERWLKQTPALLDKREMVELRHSLIIRRQGVREKMDYNTSLALAARKEVADIGRKYPEYAKELLEMTEQYEKTMTAN